MRYLLLAIIVCTLIFSCNKNNGNSAPEIKFKSITPTVLSTTPNSLFVPLLTIEIKDAEGDIGFKEQKDTSYIYIKNLTISPFRVDSFKFPESLSAVAKKNFKADVAIDLRNTQTGGSGVFYPAPIVSGRPKPFLDSMYFEVYVKDFAKNKSNVIRTDAPLVLITP
jgi:hypothetical protein